MGPEVVGFKTNCGSSDLAGDTEASEVLSRVKNSGREYGVG